MNLGQTLITLGMFVLLIMTVISANRILMDNNIAPFQSEALTSSAIIASDVLKEITRKPFDQKVVIDTTKTPWRQDTTGTALGSTAALLVNPDTTKLTVYSSNPTPYQKWPWGVRSLVSLPDTLHTDKSPNYYLSENSLKDVDDYDGYVRYVRYPNPLVTDYYTVSVKVYYIVFTTPDVLSTTRSLFKQIDVTVKSKYTIHFNPATQKDDSSTVFSAVASY